MGIPPRNASTGSLRVLAALFLVSGFAALIYQIVWQRVLFTAFGVNIESVTITVSVFMFGLGVGALVGGALSKRFPRRLPLLFLLCEVAIGLFGVISLPLMKAVGDLTLHSSLLTLSLITYALLCVPTMFMGATLPILVAHLHRHYQHVGKVVGVLYFINTIGSGLSCFLTATVLFAFFGKQTAVHVAALCNFAVGLLVYLAVSRVSSKAGASSEGSEVRASPDPSPLTPSDAGQRRRFLLILLLSAAIGYISLSQEILWFRVVGYSTAGRPDVFAHVLGLFLLGIALGSLFSRWLSSKPREAILTWVAGLLAISALLYYFSVPLIGQMFTRSQVHGLIACGLGVVLVTFLVGAIFPALCHYGIESQAAVGWSLSLVYFANIVGSTAGPLLTGFVLMEFLPLQQMILCLSLCTFALAGLLWWAASGRMTIRLSGMAILLLGAACLLTVHDTIYDRVLEKLHFKTHYSATDKPYKYVFQNRNGIITVWEETAEGTHDTVYGGGIYDGRINIDPVWNSNWITRAYMVAALHPQPRQVLEVGLSTGSWARVLANHAGVEQLTVVEINPNYRKLVLQYPLVASVLDDPKVKLVIDDGRRWLKRNPDRKFDVIVMNTTFHWRDQATNLLSDEFLRLCRAHLKEGGVVYYNTTGSDDVAFTAAQVFPHVTRYGNFVAGSDEPFAMNAEEKRRNLHRFLKDGKPLFPPPEKGLPNQLHLVGQSICSQALVPAGTPIGPLIQGVVAVKVPEFDTYGLALLMLLEDLVASDLSNIRDRLRATPGLLHITDDNMATEFKRPLGALHQR